MPRLDIPDTEKRRSVSEQAVILGDGQMALALADALVERGVLVRIWGPIPPDAQRLARTRRSPRLPQFKLPEEVEVTAEDRDALADATVIFSAIPTQYLRAVWQRLLPHAPAGVPVVSVTKGIEVDTLLCPTGVIAEVLRESVVGQSLCALSGPSVAAELIRHLPASLVAASVSDDLANRVQDLLSVPWLRIYRHDDVIGVEMAGATKNVIALAAGMVDGLGIGANAKSALLARGLAEIARLGIAMGARRETFFGVAGVGDLATTCFSPNSRNRTCGERLARGEPLEQILSSMTSVVEGVPTTKSVMALAQAHRVEMPISAAVYAILFEHLPPLEAIDDLMSREAKAEHIG